MPFRSFQLTQLVLFTISYCNLISLLYFNHCDISTAEFVLFYMANDCPNRVCGPSNFTHAHRPLEFGISLVLLEMILMECRMHTYLPTLAVRKHSGNRHLIWHALMGGINYIADTVPEMILEWQKGLERKGERRELPERLCLPSLFSYLVS